MRLLVVCLLVVASKISLAQYDTLHYLPPVYVNDAIKNTNSGCRDHYLILSTNEASTFQVTITRGDGSPFSDYAIENGSQTGTGVFNLSRSTPIKLKFNDTGVDVEHIFSESSLNTVLDTGGYILEAPRPFFANIRHLAGSQGASLTSKGTTAFGTNFFAGFQASGAGTSGTDVQHSHFISVMATLNNTNVTISNFNDGVTMIGQPSSGVPLTSNNITFTLNAGQSYIVAQTKSNVNVHMDEFSGIRVVADKEVAVNSGSWTGSSNSGGSRDIGIDQLVPATFAGDKYVLVAGNASTVGNNSLEKFIAITTQPDTTFIFSGAGGVDTIVGQGNYKTFNGADYWGTVTAGTGFENHSNASITSSKPILIYQTLFGSSSGATSSMNLIPPLADCIGSDSIYIHDARQFGTNSVVTVTSPVTSTIKIENQAGTTLATINPSTENLPGTTITDFRTQVFSIPASATDVLITGDERFTLGFLGASGVVGGAGYMSAFSDRDVEYSTSDPLFIGNGRARLDLCEGNPAFISIDDPEIYDSFQWLLNNAIIPGEINDSLQVTTVGDYKAIATYCALPLESTLVSVDEFGSPGEQGFSKISAMFESETFDGFLNNSNIVAWDEQSKDFNNASVVTNGPSVSNVPFNKPGFHPIPFFDASNGEYLKTINPLSNLDGSNRYAFFVVLKDSNSTSGHAAISFDNSAAGPKLLKTPTGYRFAQELTSPGGPITADIAVNTDEYILLSCVSDGSTVRLYANGKEGPVNFGNTTSNTLDIGSQFILGADEEGVNRFFNGFIAEFVLFDTSLTATERQIVETYYGVKYGITFDPTNDEVGINDGDYVSNNGSVVWDYSANTAYHHSVASIGLDECGRLRQWQNRDANNNDVVSIGIGTIANTVGSNPNSFANDNTYFVWGRNTGAFEAAGETDFGTTLNGEVIQGRVERVWKSQETGTVGSLRVQFNLLGGTGTSIYDLADTRLLVDANGVFASGATSIAPTSFNNATGIVNFDHNFTPGTGFFFSLGTVNIVSTPLPISLTNFEAYLNENSDVVCQWSTSSESNNAYFTIEKSLDGQNWQYVGNRDGAGNSSAPIDYNLVDPNPFFGLSYYRLSQTDFDGTTTIEGIESVVVENVNKPTVNVFPNPAKTLVTIQISEAISGTVSIFSSTGQIVKSQSMVTSSEANIDITDLSAGVYYVRVQYDNATESVKLIVE